MKRRSGYERSFLAEDAALYLPAAAHKAPGGTEERHRDRDVRIQAVRAHIERVEVVPFRIPTDGLEGDGTYRWDSTVLVLVKVAAAGVWGIGYSYADGATARLVEEKLAEAVLGQDPLDIPACRGSMISSLRNLGIDGVAMLAVSAVDCALWDLKAKLLGQPLVSLLGAARTSVSIYGSGGFTTYSRKELQLQLGGWVEQGIRCVKMKIGNGIREDTERVGWGREAIGSEAELYVDANGAYAPKEALALAYRMMAHRVSWLEEPVLHHDREGMRLVREQVPPGMEIAAGEYGFTLGYHHDLMRAGAVDVVQADATRCGISGFLEVAVLCQAFNLPLSAHSAPTLHLHPCCAALPVRHLEYFHDHVRIEKLFFDGFVEPVAGSVTPDMSRAGLGITLREEVARRYRL